MRTSQESSASSHTFSSFSPTYDDVAAELAGQGSAIRLAKVDADLYGSLKSTYGIYGFPTLIFFNNGESLKYNGKKTKDFMVDWLIKKAVPPVTETDLAGLSQ